MKDKKSNDKEQIATIMNIFRRNTLFPFKLEKKVEIRESQVHGKGLFALRHISRGEILTFYPAHGFGMCGNRLFRNDNDDFMNSPAANDYKKDVTLEFSIFGNPEVQEENLLGHIINDSNMLTISDTSEIGIRNSIYKYNILSNRDSNCILLPNTENYYAYVVSTTEISANSEIFAYYGEEYWLEKTGVDKCVWENILQLPDIIKIRSNTLKKLIY